MPSRLQKLIEEFDGRFGEGNERDELQAAGHQGVTNKDLCFRVPELAAVAARRFGSIWAEVDAYCQSGDHLMTLATPPELVAFREWFQGEFNKQRPVPSPPPGTRLPSLPLWRLSGRSRPRAIPRQSFSLGLWTWLLRVNSVMPSRIDEARVWSNWCSI